MTQLRYPGAMRPVAVAAVVGFALVASACGDGSPRGSGTQSETVRSARAYSACMRSHGVPNFPDPDSKGRIRITSRRDSGGKTLGDSSPQFEQADRACRRLLPNGGRPTAQEQAKAQQAMLSYARCMRSHGVPRFPDPKPGGALEIGKRVGVDPNSPQFKAAQKTCQKLVPGAPIAASPPEGKP